MPPAVLHNPLRRRMVRHIAVQNLAPFMLDDKEAIQHPEVRGRHGKEIHGGDDLAMILQKSQPLPLRVLPVKDAAQIPKKRSSEFKGGSGR